MKLKTLGIVALLALAIKGCPKGEKFDASRVNRFEIIGTWTQPPNSGSRYLPSQKMLPGIPTDYFYVEIIGDEKKENVCTYEGGNVFYTQHESKTPRIVYNRIMPGSPEAERLQKVNPNLEILAGN